MRSFFLFFMAGLSFLISCYVSAFEIGIHSHFRRYTQPSDYYLKEIHDLGFNSFRSDYLWEGVEEEKGVLKLGNNLRKEDQAFNDGAKYGLTGLLVLAYGNHLYDNSGYPTTPEAIKAYVNYAYWTASRFKGKVKYYEIWNEWVNGTGIRTKPLVVPPAKVFVEIVQKASAAIKKADPDAIVVAGSISPFSPRDIAWFKEAMDLGVLKYLDGVSLHAYSYKDGNYELRTADGNIKTISEFEEEVAEFAGKPIPIYITEVGIPTYTGDGGLDEQEVARYVVKYNLLAKTRNYIKGVWWYDLVDDGDRSHVNEDRFGFYKRSGQKKTAANYYQQIAELIKNYDVEKFTEDNNGHVKIMLKKQQGQRATVEWKNTNSKDDVIAITLYSDGKETSLYL